MTKKTKYILKDLGLSILLVLVLVYFFPHMDFRFLLIVAVFQGMRIYNELCSNE